LAQRQIEDATIKLKNMIELNEDYAGFEDTFFTMMHEGKDKEAIKVLLKVVYYSLTSEGEDFNQVLKNAGKSKANEFRAWIMKAKAKYV